MKLTELKLGDLVSCHGEILKVAFCGMFMCSAWDENEDLCDDINYDELTPIPLTKEILEKNRWQWDEDDWVFFCEFCPNVYLAPVGKGFSVVNATGEQLGRINAAVHELQHLLWALSIDDDLEI